MLPVPHVPSTTTPAQPPVPIGVGIDTSRYGHVAVFLRADHQPAAAPLSFVESDAGIVNRSVCRPFRRTGTVPRPRRRRRDA